MYVMLTSFYGREENKTVRAGNLTRGRTLVCWTLKLHLLSSLPLFKSSVLTPVQKCLCPQHESRRHPVAVKTVPLAVVEP